MENVLGVAMLVEILALGVLAEILGLKLILHMVVPSTVGWENFRFIRGWTHAVKILLVKSSLLHVSVCAHVSHVVSITKILSANYFANILQWCIHEYFLTARISHGNKISILIIHSM